MKQKYSLYKFSLLLIIFCLVSAFVLPKNALAVDCQAEINLDVNPKTPASLDVTLNYNGWVRSTQFNSQGSGTGEGYCFYGSTTRSVVTEFQVDIIDKANGNKILDYKRIPLVQYSTNQISFSGSINLKNNGYAANANLRIAARVKMFALGSVLQETLRESAPVPVNIGSVTYGCLADDGVYACGNNSGCSTVPNNACTNKACIVINPTSMCNKTVEVAITPTTVKPGGQVQLTISNLIGNVAGQIIINGDTSKNINFGSLPVTIPGSSLRTGQNTLTVVATQNGQSLPLKNQGQVSVTVDQNAAPPGNVGTKKYACKAKDNTYLCSDSTDFGLQNIDTSKCATLDVLQVDACSCGKTDEQIKTQCTAATNPTIPTDKLINPIPTEGLLETFLGITKGFLAGLAIWAVIAIIFAGFRMVISAGNEEAITQAKKAITWAILGLVVALLSFSMVAIVQNILNVDTTKFDPQLPGSTTPSPSPSPSGAYIIQKSKNV